jgi:two-component system, OmpR family, response regulator
MRLLVVEDETKLAAYLKRGLEADGHAVDIATDGEEGLWFARNQPYDVIVLDILLPKVNGFSVCATLREESNWTPILMLTAKDGEFDIAEALDAGADDYLIKPFSFVVLSARIRALVRRGAPARPTVLRVGDLRLDPAAHTAERAGTELTLTAKEFSLLEYLMRHPGEAVSKTDILNAVWDWDFEGDPNVVEVYIGYLRRKIDQPFDRASIETIRGVGYRMRADR